MAKNGYSDAPPEFAHSDKAFNAAAQPDAPQEQSTYFFNKAGNMMADCVSLIHRARQNAPSQGVDILIEPPFSNSDPMTRIIMSSGSFDAAMDPDTDAPIIFVNEDNWDQDMFDCLTQFIHDLCRAADKVKSAGISADIHNTMCIIYVQNQSSLFDALASYIEMQEIITLDTVRDMPATDTGYIDHPSLVDVGMGYDIRCLPDEPYMDIRAADSAMQHSLAVFGGSQNALAHSLKVLRVSMMQDLKQPIDISLAHLRIH